MAAQLPPLQKLLPEKRAALQQLNLALFGLQVFRQHVGEPGSRAVMRRRLVRARATALAALKAAEEQRQVLLSVRIGRGVTGELGRSISTLFPAPGSP